MTTYNSIIDAIKSFGDEDVPIFVPVFEQVSYAEFMVSQLTGLGLSNFVLCDNASTYVPMQRYLEKVSKEHRVCYLDKNYGPRIYSDKELLPYMPDWFIVTDPDLIFNKDLPNNFIEKMIEASAHHQLGKVGFALDIWGDAASKFFNFQQVLQWEEKYWWNFMGLIDGENPIFDAPIDTTFALHNTSICSYYINNGANVPAIRAGRIAGKYSCEHMGWWKDQPITKEEYDYYKLMQTWGSTENEKRRLGYA